MAGRKGENGTIYMKDPYLSNLFAAIGPSQVFRRRAKDYLCLSLTRLAADQEEPGWES